MLWAADWLEREIDQRYLTHAICEVKVEVTSGREWMGAIAGSEGGLLGKAMIQVEGIPSPKAFSDSEQPVR